MTNLKDVAFYQIISRNNDPNGQPYRLIMMYDHAARLIGACESRSSLPNVVAALEKSPTGAVGTPRLLSIHVGANEYKVLKASCTSILGAIDHE